MNYQQIIPTEPLRKYVRYFWVLEDDSSEFQEKSFKIMPDGLPGLIFQENSKAFYDKKNQPLPPVFLYGQTTRHTESKASGPFRNIGVYFQPTALKSIFWIDANELTDQHVDLANLTKDVVAEQLLNATSLEQQIELLSAFFLKQADSRKNGNEKVKFALIQFQQGNALRNIQADLNISERSLERLFKQNIGVSPKLFARINRFQSTLNDLRNNDFENLTDIAYKNNYFDQSHFIRDFREFAGTSPKQFIIQANEQVENFPEWKK